MKRWRRLGLLPLDVTQASWASTHAALPVVEPLEDRRFEVFLSLRDLDGRARIGRTVLTMGARPMLEPLDPQPVLDLGALGAFDDSGVTSSCLVKTAGRRLLYYTGWSRGVTVPFYLAAGVAADESGMFRRLSAAPLLDRSAVDPYLTASPFVLREEGRWRMWYVSATEWRECAPGPRHYYNIRYAESADGIEWHRDGLVCLDYASEDEHAFARPCVVHRDGSYRMWYAVRGARYRIRHAVSQDGKVWRRLGTEQGLDPAGDGWDSEMVAYPFVFRWEDATYMLYNGNGYGRSGVGMAVLEDA